MSLLARDRFDRVKHAGVAAASHRLRGLLRHPDDFGRVADLGALYERAVLREQGLQNRLVAMEQKMHLGMTAARDRGARNGSAWAGIAAHCVNRENEFPDHALPRPVEVRSHEAKLKGAVKSKPLPRLSLPPPRPRGHHNGRRTGKRDEDASIPRNWGIRHGPRFRAHGGNDAYCAWKARFFFSAPPWRTPLKTQPPGRDSCPVRRR